jgi:RNA polymerase sigma-70 factor (ECF subfamily)
VVSRAQRGDGEAFALLMETYQKPVYNLCYRMLSNQEDAEDAAQETFLRAYRFIKRYDANRPFATWLLSIAAHYCIDQIRRRRNFLISIEDLPTQDVPDSLPSPEHSAVTAEDQRRVRALLERLEPIDRAAIIMYYWYDFSYEEICQSLSLTLSAVKSRLHRARKALAQTAQTQPQPQPGIFASERIPHEASIV